MKRPIYEEKSKLRNLSHFIPSPNMKFSFLLFTSLLATASMGFAQSDCLLQKHTSEVNGRLELEQTNSYNSEGKLIEESKIHMTHYGEAYTSKRLFEYNRKGFILSETDYHNGTFRKRKSYQYDDRGQLISTTETLDSLANAPAFNRLNVTAQSQSEKLFFEPGGSVSGKEISKETADGKPLLFQIVNAEGKINHSSEYSYADNGLLVYQKRDDRAGNMMEETYFEYNQDQLLQKDSTFLNDKLIAQTLYEYTGNLLSKKTRLGRNDRVEYIINYSYDASGNNTGEVFIYNGEPLSSIKREIDQNGNKVQETHFNKDNNVVRNLTWEYNCPN
jgi:hypothetical protein